MGQSHSIIDACKQGNSITQNCTIEFDSSGLKAVRLAGIQKGGFKGDADIAGAGVSPLACFSF